MGIEPKFKEDDYIINHTSGDMAIIKGLNKKGYYTFKEYYGGMFEELKDAKNYTLQKNYQKFFELCDEDEKKKLNEIIKTKNKVKNSRCCERIKIKKSH